MAFFFSTHLVWDQLISKCLHSCFQLHFCEFRNTSLFELKTDKWQEQKIKSRIEIIAQIWLLIREFTMQDFGLWISRDTAEVKYKTCLSACSVSVVLIRKYCFWKWLIVQERGNVPADPMAPWVCHCLTVLLLIRLIFYFSKQQNFVRSTPIDVCSLTQSGL